MTLAEALRAATLRLRLAGVDDPARDARVLLAAATGVDRGRITLHLPDNLDSEAAERFGRMIQAREARQPVSQIVGGRAFHGHWFRVTADVLDPRPETEILVDLALYRPFLSVLDLGTGSGAILISLLAARPDAVGTGTDISDAALRVASANADALGVADRTQLIRSDWFASVSGRFDLIVSNPPYIARSEMQDLSPDVRDWEPHLALTDGGDGLSAYRTIAAQACEFLSPGGRLIVEVGATQAETVGALFAAAGLEDVAIHSDMDNRGRVVSGQKPRSVT